MLLDIDWALAELEVFLKLTELHHRPNPPGVIDLTAHMSNRGNGDDIIASAQVVEQIFDRVLGS